MAVFSHLPVRAGGLAKLNASCPPNSTRPLAFVAWLASLTLGEVPQVRADDDAQDGHMRQPIQEVHGAELVYPQELAELQVTLIPTYRHVALEHLGYLDTSVEYGLTDFWQLGASWDAPMVRDGGPLGRSAGVGGAELGTLLSWMHVGDTELSVAAAFELGIPVGGEQRRPDDEGLRYEPYVTVAWDLPRATGQVFINAGAGFGEGELDPFVNAGAFLVTGDVLRPFVTGSHGAEGSYVTPGVGFALPGTWELIFGASIGLSAISDDLGLALALVYELDLAGNEDESEQVAPGNGLQHASTGRNP